MTSLLAALVFVLLVVVVWQCRELRARPKRVDLTPVQRNSLFLRLDSARRVGMPIVEVTKDEASFLASHGWPADTRRRLDAIYDQRWRTKDDLATEQAQRDRARAER